MRAPQTPQKDFKPVPAGNHVAICNGVIDLGLQPGSDAFPDPKFQLYLRFELPNEPITFEKDGKETTGPMSIGRTFTFSMNEKANLRKFVQSWLGADMTDVQADDFEFKSLLGKRCLLNVTHRTSAKGKLYGNVGMATPLPKGMSAGQAQVNSSVYFSLDEHSAMDGLPDWLKQKIDGRITDRPEPEHEVMVIQSGSIDPSDDIPFAAIGKWL